MNVRMECPGPLVAASSLLVASEKFLTGAAVFSDGHMRNVEKVDLMIQVVAAVFLVCALCMHLTEVGFVGLGIAIIVTTCTGKIEEHDVSRCVHMIRGSVCQIYLSAAASLPFHRVAGLWN